MGLKYLKKLRPILNRAGKKHGITVEEGEFIIGKFFESFRDALTDPRVPKVMLPLFGTFQPKIKYIYRSLRASIRFHKSGGTTREYLNARIRRIWPVRNRLIEEANKGTTWNSWRKESVKEKFIQLVKDEREEKKKSKEVVYGANNNVEKSKRIFGQVSKGIRPENSEGGQS